MTRTTATGMVVACSKRWRLRTWSRGAEPVAADRLLLFSDAVFAISATLLALDVRVPAGLSSAQFLPALRDQLPATAAYAFSFGVIGQLWLFHHRIFGFIARVDTPILVRSLVLLALIAFMPFPVRLLSDYHDQPGRGRDGAAGAVGTRHRPAAPARPAGPRGAAATLQPGPDHRAARASAC